MDSCFARPLTAATPYTADLLLRELQILQKKFPAASDRVLTQKLNEAGVDVKRRTVNKYRRKLEGQ